MKKEQIEIVAGVVIVIAGIIFFVTRGEQPSTETTADQATGEETIAPAPEETPTETTTTTPSTTTPNSTTKKSTPSTTTEEPKTPSTYVTIDYKAGAVFNVRTYEVQQGKHVVLRVTSTASDTLLVDGLGLSTTLAAGTQGTIEFDATNAGLYNVKLVAAGETIGRIQIIPAE